MKINHIACKNFILHMYSIVSTFLLQRILLWIANMNIGIYLEIEIMFQFNQLDAHWIIADGVTLAICPIRCSSQNRDTISTYFPTVFTRIPINLNTPFPCLGTSCVTLWLGDVHLKTPKYRYSLASLFYLPYYLKYILIISCSCNIKIHCFPLVRYGHCYIHQHILCKRVRPEYDKTAILSE